jgi:hypothetical protein
LLATPSRSPFENGTSPRNKELVLSAKETKKILWAAVLPHFNLPPPPTEDNEAIRLQTKKKVKEWALMKMATQFPTFKKILYT